MIKVCEESASFYDMLSDIAIIVYNETHTNHNCSLGAGGVRAKIKHFSQRC